MRNRPFKKSHRCVDEICRARGACVADQKRVLVIEDAAATVQLLEISLSIDGFEVITRGDGPSGLDAALELAPDIVLLDIALPGMDGWEVLDRLRSDARGRDVPVIVITAHDVAASRNLEISSRAQMIIAKPFDLAELRNAVESLAAGVNS